MRYLYFFLALFLSFFTTEAFAQTSNKNQQAVANYNVPPGYKMSMKMKVYDLSHKLTGKPAAEKYTQEDLKFLKNIPENEIASYKEKAPDYYNYYMEGDQFIKSLSTRVKTTYTNNELWYIYAFDQKLKQQLTTIK